MHASSGQQLSADADEELFAKSSPFFLFHLPDQIRLHDAIQQPKHRSCNKDFLHQEYRSSLSGHFILLGWALRYLV